MFIQSVKTYVDASYWKYIKICLPSSAGLNMYSVGKMVKVK